VREGNFIYLTCSASVEVVDISDPTQPTYVGHTNYFQGSPNVATSYDNVFVSDDAGLRVLPIQCRHSGVEELPATTLRLVCGPNPIRESGIIRLESRTSGPLRLTLFGVNGSRLRTIFEGGLPAGAHDFGWDGRDEWGRMLPSGTYLVRAETLERRVSRRITLVR
jgi:hypothetical protein